MTHQNDRRARANRENAKKPTGPRTPEGKTKSSMNALKHGLLANSVVVPDCPDLESQQHFNELLESLSDEYNPVGVVEKLLVETIAVSYWRLRRALRLEAAEISERVDTFKRWHSKDQIGRASLPTTEKTHMILRYETIIERRLNRATARLEQLQQKRKNKNPRMARLSVSRRSGLHPDSRVAPSNSFGGDCKNSVGPIPRDNRPPVVINPCAPDVRPGFNTEHPTPGTHPTPCAPDVRPGFNTNHNRKQNEANPQQPYAPSFLKQPVTLPKTTPAGYVGYQPCKLKENR